MSVLLSPLVKWVFDIFFFTLCFEILHSRTCSVQFCWHIFFLFFTKQNQKKKNVKTFLAQGWNLKSFETMNMNTFTCWFVLCRGPSFCCWRAVSPSFGAQIFPLVVHILDNVVLVWVLWSSIKRKINMVTEWRSNLSIYLFRFFSSSVAL